MMLRFLQNHPHLLEVVYARFERFLRPFQRWLRPNGRLEPGVTWVEKVGKETVFDCRMCGQCILHATGMTCPMTCPKQLRNGPCGGVRANGHCEGKPQMRCVWVQAYERAQQMPIYRHELNIIQPPVNHRLQDTSSWISMLHGIDTQTPPGWTRTSSHNQRVQILLHLLNPSASKAAAG